MSVEQLLETLQLPLFDPRTIFPSLDTSYTKHFTLNHVASISELPTIRGIISRHREQINAMDTIVARVESILHQLYEKRDQVLSEMRTHEGFISCIRRLPSDVPGKIFMQCLPKEEYLTPSKKAAPLLLTCVCRWWRGVALDTPRLWCPLKIKEPREDLKQMTQQISFYRERWLKSASLYPLTLAVDLRSTSKSWTTTAGDFALLYTSRCKQLSIHFRETGDLVRMLEETPALEYLALHGEVKLLETEKPILIFHHHPRLRTLVIEALSFHTEFLPGTNPGWANLTCLVLVFRQLACVDSCLFLPLLEHCPNLERLAFSCL